MVINVEAIATAALTALVTSGVAIFAAKTFIAGMIDSRIKRADEEYLLRLNEEHRRRKDLYDRQVEVLDALTTLIYRIRDASRKLRDDDDRQNFTAAEEKLRTIVQEFEENLFTGRSVVPQTIFAAMHEIRPPIAAMLNNIEALKHANQEQRVDIRRSIDACVKRIDAIYQTVVPVVHQHRGV